MMISHTFFTCKLVFKTIFFVCKNHIFAKPLLLKHVFNMIKLKKLQDYINGDKKELLSSILNSPKTI